jgi:cystathionine beta-lyase/cystathionine gamma-synthase
MQPHKLGVDIVCHSATKYLGGHSDITGGAICANQERIDGIIRHEINLLGSILHPFQAWLLNRGMHTLELRLKRHEATANTVATWLENRKEVARVNHVSLGSFPQRDLYKKTMSGSGGLFSFEPQNQDPSKVKKFADALKIFQRGVSWGGFESLVVALPVQPLGYKSKKWIVRLFCGLEAVEDLIADIDQALVHLK